MPRFTILLILLCLCPIISKAQTISRIDSLEASLQDAQEDTNKVNLYLEFFNTDLYYDNPQKVINYSLDALELSKQLDFHRGNIEARTNLGSLYRVRSEIDSALMHYEEAIQLAKEVDYYTGLKDAIIGKGNALNKISEWNRAIENFNEVIDLARARGDSVTIASAYNNIGNIYLNQAKLEEAVKSYQKSVELGDEEIREVALINIAVVHTSMGHIDLASEYFKQSMEMAVKLNKRSHIPFILKNQALLEKKSGNYSKAIEYFDQALEYYYSQSDDYNVSEILYNLGNLHHEQGDYQSAIKKYQESQAIREKIKDKSGVCYSKLALGVSLMELNRWREAKAIILEAEQCAEEISQLTTKSDASQRLAEIYEREGNHRRALAYHIRFKQYSDSLNSIRNENAIEDLEAKYQTEQKEKEIELLSAENEVASLRLENQQTLRNFLLVTAFILSLLLFTMYNQYRIKTKTNKKLRDLDKLKSNFYTNISHEFRTPLTLVLSPLERVIEKSKDAEVNRYAHLAKRNATRLLDLTNELMDLNKLEAGKMQLKVSPQNLDEFLKVATSSFDSLAESKNIAFEKSIEIPSESLTFFDHDNLQKVINNLLSNAFKFTPQGGKIRFEAYVSEGNLMLSVADTGPGLSEDDKVKIFERFQQASNADTQQGTGIGLTLTRELVNLHKGKLMVASELGRGSTFSVILPVGKQAYSPMEIASKLENGSHSKVKDKMIPFDVDETSSREDMPILLIVEDNDDLRNYLISCMQDQYNVHKAINGKEGLAKAQEIIPDIIISDWMMPEMDGVTFCKEIKSNINTSHVPVIMLTAKADKPSKLEGLGIGADDYLTKPFDHHELVIRTQNLVDQRKALREKYADVILLEPTKTEITSPDKVFMENAMEVLNHNMDDEKFSVEHFSKLMGMSRMQLHRKLKALTDQSASEFIRNFRLLKAKEMIANGQLTVSEIAYACGFGNLSYFSKCFKEKFGSLPSQFQELNRN